MKTEMSARDKKFVEKIIENYNEKEETKLDKLRALNRKAREGAKVFAYVFGSIGSLVLGLGMCIAMKIILPKLMALGIVIGLVGIAMVSLNYVIYKKLLERGKNKYSKQVLELSKELLNEDN